MRMTWLGLTWHVEETFIRVNGQCRNLWRALDQNGNLIGFRLKACRDATAAPPFFSRARDRARLCQPLCIITDKAPAHTRVLAEINGRPSADDAIWRITQRYLNNCNDADNAALKRFPTPLCGLRSLSSAKAAARGWKTVGCAGFPGGKAVLPWYLAAAVGLGMSGDLSTTAFHSVTGRFREKAH